jgi:membrane fusion protein (multidrug efflux system)
VSHAARLEVEQSPLPVQAPVAGQVAFANVYLGQSVREGEVLVRLDSRALVLRRAELQTALRTGRAAVEALELELAAEENVRGAAVRVAQQASAIATARVLLDAKTLEFKEEEVEVGQRLRDAALVSSIDVRRTVADAETQRARVMVAEAQAELDRASSSMTLREREARLATVRSSILQASAELERLASQIASLDHELELTIIRAPSSGVIADVLSISNGMTLSSDVRLATVVSPSALRVVSHFEPRHSSGRIAVGQKARLRFDAFPWTQYGTQSAVVSAVGLEPRDGQLRVELLMDETEATVRLQHGMTGSCEIQVDEVTPWHLLLDSLSQTQALAPDGAIAGGA